jgi:prepilin-type N-terminal cleavage/methylation domain-containing protein
MKKAFTIIELLVAMGLLSVLIAISGLVFSTAVKAHRAANATGEISAKLQAFTHQLDADFGNGHLQKDGEFLLVWAPSPELKRDGTILDKDGNGIPDRYLSFDRILFFTANGDMLQSYNEQPADTNGDGAVDSTKPAYSTEARLCYNFGRDAYDTRAHNEPNPVKRMFCRTHHLITADTDLLPWPDLSVAWDPADFVKKNFWDKTTSTHGYEYQTMDKIAWFNIPGGIKEDMLMAMMDITFKPSVAAPGCPQVDLTSPPKTAATIHQLFMQGVGQFRVQVWRSDLTPNRWYPEIDPDGNGDYSDSDYYVTSEKIVTDDVGGIWNINDDASHFSIHFVDPSIPLPLSIPFTSALKFTFTLYDSNGVFKDGKTFTYIVYLK